ncbi:MAG: radical SAM protein [Acidobacteria bacterium]|nr:radical SAM protein [Acidobacteriota bacterium]
MITTPSSNDAAARLSQPLAAYLELTYACNWRCTFCYNPRHSDRKRLETEEWMEVLNDLRSLGTLSLTLTGGEPMLHPGALELARRARELHFVVRLFTNGSLIDARAARFLKDEAISVEMSLHGATAEVHDGATARQGSFVSLARAVKTLAAEGVPMAIKTPVTRLNERELDAMIALVQEWGVPHRLDPTITPRDNGDLSPLDLTAALETRRRLARMEVETGSATAPVKRAQGGTNCGLGRTSLAIDPEGNVFPCMQWRHRALGNVRQTRLLELWPNSSIRREAAKVAIDANDTMLALGGAASEYSFCPALAYQETGSALTPDEAFLQRAALAAEARKAVKVSDVA